MKKTRLPETHVPSGDPHDETHDELLNRVAELVDQLSRPLYVWRMSSAKIPASPLWNTNSRVTKSARTSQLRAAGQLDQIVRDYVHRCEEDQR